MMCLGDLYDKTLETSLYLTVPVKTRRILSLNRKEFNILRQMLSNQMAALTRMVLYYLNIQYQVREDIKKVAKCVHNGYYNANIIIEIAIQPIHLKLLIFFLAKQYAVSVLCVFFLLSIRRNNIHVM